MLDAWSTMKWYIKNLLWWRSGAQKEALQRQGLYKGHHPINAIKWKRTERTLSHDPLPPRQSVRLNGDLRAASLGTITTDLQPMPVKRS